MGDTRPNKQNRKSRIAIRFRNINAVLLVLVLILMMIAAAVIINGINREAAQNLVRAYSVEAAEKFHAFISEDLVLVREAARSKAITSWSADEENDEKKTGAFDLMTDFINIQNSAYLYLGISNSGNEYTIDSSTDFEALKPFDRLSPLNISDAWYFRCLNSKNDYTFNIDIDKASGLWRLWINHKIIKDGQITGVFCSGLRIPDIFRNIFAGYPEKKIRGYFIDSRGSIQSSSTSAGIYTEGNDIHIQEENNDPAFAALLDSHWALTSDSFDSDVNPVTVKLSRGLYGYAAIKPVQGTDWAAVVICDNYTLSGARNLVPLLVTMLAILVIYWIGRNALINRLIFSPLAHLTRSLSENKSAESVFFGSDRNDEIGDLARSIQSVTWERENQDRLLYAVNRAASVLLAIKDERKFEASLVEGMELMGQCVDADRVQIWKNQEISDELFYVKQYEWINLAGQQEKPIQPGEKFSFNDSPEWKSKFLNNECINGPLSKLTPDDRKILEPYGIKSILIIPVHVEKRFWGFVSFDDCRTERFFTNNEINILRSASLMMVSAVSRNLQAAQIQDEHERIMLLINSSPLACRLWNRNYEIFECNDESIKLFKMRDKQEYMKRYWELSPEYQSDGQVSRVKIYKTLKKAFADGRYVFEWMHQTLDGTLIPAEITLVRLNYGDGYVIAGYTRDLREQKRMMGEIERRGNLLDVMNRATALLFTAETGENFGYALIKSMELLGNYLEVDRLQIWQNDTIDGELYFVHKYQWLSAAGQQKTSFPLHVMYPYSVIPESKNKFLRNEYLNRPISAIPAGDSEFLRMHDTKSIVIIPIFIQNQFWGLFRIDDCRTERSFTEEEIDILRSGGLMIASALNRSRQTEELRMVHEHNNLMLNSNPIACSLWRDNCTSFDCNDATAELFSLKDKREYMDRFLDLSPKYQPDGSLSSEASSKNVKKAFTDGKHIFKWMHQKYDGTPIPSEVTLTRVPYGDGYVVAGYMRDLREHEAMMIEIERRDSLLNTVNQAATILLQSESRDFENNLLKCMGMLGSAVDADRVYIWENSTVDGKLFCSQRYEWSGGAEPQQNTEYTTDISYDDIAPSWEEILSRGNCINGLVSQMTPEVQAQLSPQGIMSLFVAPVFVRDKFWGFVGYDNCHKEQLFTENEQSILRSGGLLIANAVLRNSQSEQLLEAHQHTQILLDAMPLACNLWDRDFNIFSCNEENVRLFGLDYKQQFIERFLDLSPEYQPDGRPSAQNFDLVKKAFDEGRNVFEWTHQKLDGTPIPAEVTLVRVAYDGDYAVAGYVRDLREQKRMIGDIEKRDNLLNAINRVAAAMLSPTDEKTFEESLLEGMELMGRNLEAECVQIWPNETINDTLHFVLRYKWLSENALRAPPVEIGTAIPYSTRWKELFLRGECVNGPLSQLPKDDQDLLGPLGLKSTVTIPLFYQEKFWGVFCLDDFSQERYFSDDEVDILRSAGLILVTAMNRNIQADQLRRAHNLLYTVNQVATILLQTDIGEFEDNLQQCMSMIGRALSADRVCIWKNSIREGKLCCTQITEWVSDLLQHTPGEVSTDIPYDENMPTWKEILTQSKYINKLTRDLLPVEQERMSVQGVKSVFATPVFVHDEFWGFVGCDNCQSEIIFTEDEASILRSGSILIATALLRNEMTINIRATAGKLEAVIANYSGIIWCVDRNDTITLFNGLYLNELGKTAEYFENRKTGDALKSDRFSGIHEGIRKTFIDGPQDINSEYDDKIYRTRTTPIYDNYGSVITVVGTFDDVTERSRLQAELKTALEEAQKANQAKSSFLANMSHEMRTPLNAIIGLSELTIGTGKLDGENFAHLEKINNAGLTLLSTVNDILDISKIEAGRFELVVVEYETPSLINDAVTQSIMRKEDKPIRFELAIDENLPYSLYGDDLRIKQIMNNLLSNAFKYTMEGMIKLDIYGEKEKSDSAGNDSVWITVRVQDTGIGIRHDDIDKLFINYTQMDTESNRKIEGTGLGLSITKKLVEMMGGSITVESEYGKGSVFTAKFLQKPASDAVIGEELANSLKNFSYSDQKRRRNSRMVRVRLPYARVLVVDDVITNLDVARGMMKPYGMQIDCVQSGQEAIDAIRRERVIYNAVFMDHMMPDMDGIEATRIIREEIGTEYAKTIPIIALTANAIVGNEEMFISRGFQAFISKPIEIDRLDAVIREWIQDEELEKSLDRAVDVNGQILLDIRSGSDRRNISERRSGIDRRSFGKLITGIDLEKGLERFGGDEESFLQILRSYVVNTRPLLETIRDVKKENLTEYAITVHGINGSSRGIYADFIGARAAALEEASKEDNFGFIEANNGPFIEAVENLINSLEEWLAQMASDNPKPEKDRPDRELLVRLLEAVEAYNMDKADMTMTEIEKYCYTDDEGLTEWLRESVDLINFEQIKEKLSAII